MNSKVIHCRGWEEGASEGEPRDKGYGNLPSLVYNKCISTYTSTHPHPHAHCYTQVNVEMVMKTMKENAEKALRLIVTTVTMMSQEDWTDTVHQAKVYTNIDRFSRSR